MTSRVACKKQFEKPSYLFEVDWTLVTSNASIGVMNAMDNLKLVISILVMHDVVQILGLLLRPVLC